MKKYVAPELEILVTKRSTFLEISGEAVGEDIFDGTFGKQFDTFS